MGISGRLIFRFLIMLEAASSNHRSFGSAKGNSLLITAYRYRQERSRRNWPSAVQTFGFLAVLSSMIALSPRDAGAADRTGSNIAAIATTKLAQSTPAEKLVNKKVPKARSGSYADHTIIGASELILILPQKIQIRAKIDTGAKSSSIDARILERFVRDGADWVRFQIYGEEDATYKLEMPVARTIRIRRAGTPRDVRPAVMMRLCLVTSRPMCSSTSPSDAN